jgi:hypothetical protein
MRTAKQKWQREKGSAEYTKAASDEYRYYVDVLEVSATEYAGVIENNFAKTAKLKLMLNIDYWVTLDWRIMRKHFEDIAGEITLADLEGDYSEIAAELETTAPDALRKAYNDKAHGKKDSYEAEITKLKAENSAVTAQLPMLEYCDKADKRIMELETEKAKIEATLFNDVKGASNLGAYEAKQREIARERAEHDAKREAKRAEIQRAYEADELYNKNLQTRRVTLLESAAAYRGMMEDLVQQRKDKLRELEAIQKMSFNGKCPTCGAELKGDDVDKQRAAFLREVELKKNTCIMQGKRIRTQLDQYEKAIKEAEDEIAAMQPRDTSDYKDKMLAFKLSKENTVWECTERGMQLMAELKALEEQPKVSFEDLSKRKGEIEEELKQQYAVASERSMHAQLTEKIERNKAAIKGNTEAMVACERKIAMIESYIEEKAEQVAKRVNSFFEGSGIVVEMQKRKKDGTFEPSCRVLCDKVPAHALNTAKRRSVSIEVARAFQKAFNLDMLVIVDNANDFDDDHVPSIKGQSIMLRPETCPLTLFTE